MQRYFCHVVVLTAVLASIDANAELQNIHVGGEIMIRARWWSRQYSGNTFGPSYSGIDPGNAPGRPMGPRGVTHRDNIDFIEMRTHVNARADFTGNVAAFIEFDSVDNWGDALRSRYQTSADIYDDTPGSTDDFALHQAYIELNQAFGSPFRIRIGRQEMELGDGWLISDRATTAIGLSWDEVRLTYAEGPWEIDAWYGIMNSNPIVEEDGDVTFTGAYATYALAEPLSVSAYWLWIRDPRSINDTNRTAFGEWIEDAVDLDDYDATDLNTIGARFFGSHGPWDYDWNIAYQFGEADSQGVFFKNNPKFGFGGIYGDDEAEYGYLGTEIEVGYTFDTTWTPRVSIGGFYFDGEDNRDISFFEWLSPFDEPESSFGFNRLFKSDPYHRVYRFSQEATNLWQARADVSVDVSPDVELKAELAKYGIIEPVDWPWAIKIGRLQVPIVPQLPFLTKEASSDLGWVTTLTGVYKYSNDLRFDFRWEHLFQGEATNEGAFDHANAIGRGGGQRDDDVDYFHLRTTILF